MYKLKLNNKITKPYECPLTRIKMNKPCGIVACHANLRGTHPTNCLYQIYGNKREFDKFDLMYCTNINEKLFKEKLNIGKQSVYEVAALFNILTRLRDNDGKMHCERCGVLRTTKGNCINEKECTRRLNLATHLLKCSRIGFTELKATKNDVFLLLNNKEKINNYIETNQWNKQWFEFLGFGEPLAEKTNLVRSCV